jgi:hypothetical protein
MKGELSRPVLRGPGGSNASSGYPIYHDYAARASSLFALRFIRAYVTNERLPPFPEQGRRALSLGGSHPGVMTAYSWWPFFYCRVSSILSATRKVIRLVPAAG